MPSLPLLILLLSLSAGACDGRHLSVHDKGSDRAFHNSSKDAAIVKLDEKTSATVKQTQSSSEKEIRSGATMEGPKGLEAPTKDVETKRDEVSETEVLIPSSLSGLLQTTPSEVRWGRRVWSLLEHESNEVTTGSSETRAVADLVAKDYAEPR